MYEFMYRETMGEAVRPFVANMISRSQRFVMRGKTLLVIGAGGFSKTFVWEAAKDFGVEVRLSDVGTTLVEFIDVSTVWVC